MQCCYYVDEILAGPGPNFPGHGPGLAYSESHSCFNIMVKYYLPSSIHCNTIIVFCAVNVTALNGFKLYFWQYPAIHINYS